MPAPATAETFLHLLDRSGLLMAEAVEQYRSATGTPRQLADALVRDRLITPFQARQLLSGRHRGFFLTDKYKVLDVLGEGGMGRVLLCEHLILHKLMAVKVLTGADDVPGAQERFLREARALAALDDPYIARVYDVDRTLTGGLFLVMEYIDGTNLHHLVAQHGAVAPGRAAGFCQMAALGLQHAQESGLIHRDIKPGNLMLDRSGVVKLLDLGLARFFDAKRNQNLTRRFDAKNVLGTADFIAPEQAVNSSSVDTRADIYSLGCTLYYLLTGRFPFPDGQPLEKLMWHQTRAFDPVRQINPDVPDGLARVLDRMVEKDPANRYQTPEAAAAALGEWTDTPSPPPASEMPRHRAASYQLGLSPPPSTANLAGSPTSPVRSPSPDSGRTEELTPIPEPSRIPPTVPTGTPTPSVSPQTGMASPARVRLARPWLAGALVIAAGLGIGVWSTLAAFKKPTDAPSQAPPAPTGPPLVVAGSTFSRPLMEHWADVYLKESGQEIEFKPVGSPLGVGQMSVQAAAIGLTDGPLTIEQVKAAEKVGGPVVQVPLALGAVAVVYALPGVGPEPVRLSGPVLADLYRGRITRWDDPALAALNPGRPLPAIPVVPVRRSDGSGTTAIFTRFLRSVVADWPQTAVGTSPNWPPVAAAMSAKGSDTLAAEVARTPGAIGYVDLTLALTRRLGMAAVVNVDGRAVSPSVAGVQAATRGVTVPPNLQVNLIDRPGPDTYPLVDVIWAVAYEQPPEGRGADVKAFLRWAVTTGQRHFTDLHYASLPESLAGPAAAVVERVK